MASESAQTAMPTPVEIIRPRMASFKVVALTVAPLIVAEQTCTIGPNARTTTEVALVTNPKELTPCTMVLTAITLIPICVVILRIGRAGPTTVLSTSATDANWFFNS